MSSIIIPSTLRVDDQIKRLIEISEKEYKGITFYLVGLDFHRGYSEYRHPEIFIELDKKYLDPIVNDSIPQYIDKTIESVRSNIEWNKARTMEEEAELEKLIKLKEKYK